MVDVLEWCDGEESNTGGGVRILSKVIHKMEDKLEDTD
jgi:hypothetical protein